VLVVNRSFARKYLGDQPIGALVPWRETHPGSVAGADIGWEVVGVVDDVRQPAGDAQGLPEIMASYAQAGPDATRQFDPVLVIRTSRDPTSYVATLRQLVRAHDPTLALDSVMTMEERVATSLAAPRTYAFLVGGFAVFALIIAAVGLFGVLGYTVAQRSREIGIRAALGASPRAIVGLVIRQALGVTAAGLLIGLALALVAVQTLARFLYGIAPRDPSTFAAVAALVLLVAAAATVVPARRAVTVDPLKVLR
jgi:ABC-type antimicrobial peptide transport system permease subunit